MSSRCKPSTLFAGVVDTVSDEDLAGVERAEVDGVVLLLEPGSDLVRFRSGEAVGSSTFRLSVAVGDVAGAVAVAVGEAAVVGGGDGAGISADFKLFT